MSLMSQPFVVPLQRTVTEKMCVIQNSSVKENASVATSVITFARTISHLITLVLKLRKLHMFVMVVLRKADAGLISITTAPLGHKRNIKLS